MVKKMKPKKFELMYYLVWLHSVDPDFFAVLCRSIKEYKEYLNGGN